jgi:hypothetical protein
VLALGKEKAIQLYNQTKEIEVNGGILTLVSRSSRSSFREYLRCTQCCLFLFLQNGARRRTSGGVFLKYVKDQKLSRREFEAIFNYAEDYDKNASSTTKVKSKKRKAKSKGELL